MKYNNKEGIFNKLLNDQRNNIIIRMINKNKGKGTSKNNIHLASLETIFDKDERNGKTIFTINPVAFFEIIVTNFEAIVNRINIISEHIDNEVWKCCCL